MSQCLHIPDYWTFTPTASWLAGSCYINLSMQKVTYWWLECPELSTASQAVMSKTHKVETRIITSEMLSCLHWLLSQDCLSLYIKPPDHCIHNLMYVISSIIHSCVINSMPFMNWKVNCGGRQISPRMNLMFWCTKLVCFVTDDVGCICMVFAVHMCTNNLAWPKLLARDRGAPTFSSDIYTHTFLALPCKHVLSR